MTTYHIISILTFLYFVNRIYIFFINLHLTCKLHNMEYVYHHDLFFLRNELHSLIVVESKYIIYLLTHRQLAHSIPGLPTTSPTFSIITHLLTSSLASSLHHCLAHFIACLHTHPLLGHSLIIPSPACLHHCPVAHSITSLLTPSWACSPNSLLVHSIARLITPSSTCPLMVCFPITLVACSLITSLLTHRTLIHLSPVCSHIVHSLTVCSLIACFLTYRPLAHSICHLLTPSPTCHSSSLHCLPGHS